MCRSAMTNAPAVCVTGANGFLGSHIVQQLLQAGYRVRGTVRNSADLNKTKHLLSLPGASARLELLSAEMRPEDSVGFDDAIDGCSAVIHTASPCKANNSSTEDVHSAVFGTLAVLRASQRAGVKTVVMTAAMSNAAPRMEGAIICETNWGDAQEHVKQGNRYSASKILAEEAAWKLVQSEKPDFRLVSILPASIVGPSLSTDVGLTNRCVLSVMKNGFQGGECPNESFSFIDVRNCAAHHIAAMEQETAHGRYLSAANSMHFNDVLMTLKDINPRLPPCNLCEDPCAPTLIDRTRQDSLGVSIKEMPEILCGLAKYFKGIGVKDAKNFVDARPTVRSSCSRASCSRRSSAVCMNTWTMYAQYGNA